MRLITLCQAGEVLPATLPSSLVPASKATKPSGVLPSTTVPLQPSSSVPLPRSLSPQTTATLPVSSLTTQQSVSASTVEQEPQVWLAQYYTMVFCFCVKKWKPKSWEADDGTQETLINAYSFTECPPGHRVDHYG